MALLNIALGENEDYNKSVVERVDKLLADYSKPQNLNPQSPDNVMDIRESSFERACMVLESKGVHSPNELTAYQYYKRIEIIQEENRKKNGRHN